MPQPSSVRTVRPSGPAPATGGLAYAEAVAGRAIPQQTRGPLMPRAKGSVNSAPAVSMESVQRRKSLDFSGPLSGMPAVATFFNAPVFSVALAGERRNKTRIFITGFSDTRSFLVWLRATRRSGLMAQIKTERLCDRVRNHCWFTSHGRHADVT